MGAPPHPGGSDLLIDLIRRAPLLEALRDGPLDRSTLQDRLGVSRATCHRHTRLLGDLGAIEKADGRFRLTESGALVAEAIGRFEREAETALQLAPVVDAVGRAPVSVDVSAFADATVTSAAHGDPHSPVARFVELVRGTETLRGIDLDAIAPLYLEDVRRRIVDGMATEDISHPEVTRNALEDYPDRCLEVCTSGNLTVKLHDDLPFALALFDDRVGVGVYEGDTRTLRTFADTDDAAVRRWAEAVYAAYESESVVMEEYTLKGFERALERRSAAG